jgi:alpha-tubulin suppressor-like RCC1 family protein
LLLLIQEDEDEKTRQLLNSLDYNTFINIVTTGDIAGQRLLSLCSTSKKLNDYCNRGFQLRDAQGEPVGELQNQYLFRLLLNKLGIAIPPGKTPKQTYIEEIIGKVWGFGSNNLGQLGLGTGLGLGSNWASKVDKDVPTLITTLSNIVQIASGDTYSLCLDRKGRVWTFGWGGDNMGKLGLGRSKNTSVPTLIPELENIVQVAPGYSHSLCLDNRGRVWCFGQNNIGQLGLGDQRDTYQPTLIPKLSNIVQVSAGSDSSLCLDNEGRIWSFGGNEYGQLGLGDNRARVVPTLIPILKGIVQISAVEGYSLCLDNQGRVWSFGLNDVGQLGLGDQRRGLFGYGNNIAIPTLNPNLENIVYISIRSTHSLCINNQGDVLLIESGEITLVPGIHNVIQVSVGNGFSLLLKE